MNYTTEEIQTAVENLVRSSIKVPQDALGVRKIDVTFTQIQEAAAGVFLLYFNAPFYVAYLGAQRLKELVDSEASLIEQVLDAIGAIDKIVFPIKDLSPLANARAALGELSSAVDVRTEGFKDIDSVPAFRRYVQNLDSFLDAYGRNVKRGGSIAQTPQSARSVLPTLLRQLQASHLELRRRAALLQGALSDFSSLNLPRVAASGVIARAREVLDTHFDDLSELSETERLETLRSVVLDLLAQKAVVRKYGAAVAPTPYHDLSGTGVGYSDADHPSSPAELTATIPGPYVLVEGNNELEFTMDGGTPFTFPLPLSFVAEINGLLQESYVIGTTNDQLRLTVGGTLYTVTLTNGTRTAAQICTDVNAVIVATTVRMEQRFHPLKLDTLVAATSLGGNNARFTLLGGSLNGLNILVGDEVDVTVGSNAGTTWTITAVDVGGTFVDVAGSAPVVVDASERINIGPAARSLRLRDTDAAGSLAARRTIGFVSDTGGEWDLTAATLGFPAGVTARSRTTLAQDVVRAINGSLSAVRAETTLTAAFTGRGRTDTADPSRLVVYRAAGSGDVNGAVPNQITITGYTLSEGSTPQVGDKLLLRSGANAGTVWTITLSTPSSIVASGVTTASTATGLEFEIGPDLGATFGWVVQVLDGVNAGAYVVADPAGSDPLSLPVERLVPIPKFGDLPVRFTANVSRETVTFQSPLDQVASEVVVDNGSLGTAAALFFSTVPSSAIGTTPYIELPAAVKALVAGDLLELFETQYNVVSRTFTVLNYEASSLILTVEPEIESDFSMSFGDGESPTPFARLRLGQVADFTTFEEGLEAWLARSEQQDAFFTNLNRLINPLLVNRNPTASAVNDAEREVQKLLASLTMDGALSYGASSTPVVTEDETLEAVIDAYVVPPVEAVDTLLNSYREKSADRAIDLLLECRFTEFFGLSLPGTSYSGNLLENIRELAREDLVIRKYTPSGRGSRVLGEVQETDHEFDVSDSDEGLIPDPPIGFQE